MTTLLVSSEELRGDAVEVSGPEFQHLFRARRLGVGEALRVSDGKGSVRLARVAQVGRRRALLSLEEVACANDPDLELVVCSALPRPDRARWLVEKCAELGVFTLLFFASSRAPRTMGSTTHTRLARVAAAALAQSDGSRLTEVRGVVAWSELVAECRAGRALVLEPGDRGKELVEVPRGGRIHVVVGPEGGLEPEELDQLIGAGAFPWRLGPRHLRIETAAVAAASRLLAR